ncbi:Glutamate mutase subunit E [Actinokineospora alba]|uniref:Glutamate mutase subunit E n=1 Tax=Actinokineospora alba TaxID=504798 RepID=A0A1H0NJ57_9PSEU|nr:methylaspartate mutase [Actinokineospora alba]TDP68739.1 glutamate mutase subunit E [Actinokineospora alba]SDH85571.1 methylaspartate mutase epsilon subunit [Actinokineospora alba]SDO92713.1 Glutamate mutase subunit E [Actinokineospora alba]
MTFAGIPIRPGTDPPDLRSCVDYIRSANRPTTADLLAAAQADGRVLIQPRCGVGDHGRMLDLLRDLRDGAAPDILSVTVDAHTRLLRFAEAERALREDPYRLNGYPLVTHGWRRGRELAESVDVPLEVRHGSPDPRDLFVTAIASGITSFEGGGIGYNLPYVKDVPLEVSLGAWAEVDRACGVLAEHGVIVERELFGTLTAVLMPPSLCLAVCVLEAVAAAAQGVRCISVAYPQGGNAVQDVAALASIRTLAARYLPDTVTVYPVLHQFMGAFPGDPALADALILYGGLVAKWGAATKVVVKTNQEAYGIPDAAANIRGIRTTRVALSHLLDGFGVDQAAVREEQEWIEREVADLVDPVLQSGDLTTAIAAAFRSGRLDVPFSASIHAHSAVMPRRDPTGAIRIARPGSLALSTETKARNERLLRDAGPRGDEGFVAAVKADIERFSAAVGH